MSDFTARRLPTSPPSAVVHTRGNATGAPGTPRTRRPAREQAVRVTARDLELLQTVIRYHAVTQRILEQTVRAGRNRQGIYRDLARLVRVGLYEDLNTGPSNNGRPRNVKALYVPTPEAYALVGSGLKSRPVKCSQVLHTLAVAEIGLSHECLGHRVVTDREIKQRIGVWRQGNSRRTPMGAPWLGSDEGTAGWMGSGRPNTHAPDLVLLAGDGTPLTAIEVELTDKSTASLRGVLSLYSRSMQFSTVVYYVPDGDAERRLRRLADDVSFDLSRRLVIRRYVPRHSED